MQMHPEQSALLICINRIRLEFKCKLHGLSYLLQTGINRIRLEFKCYQQPMADHTRMVLIESDWNLNPVTVETVAVRMPY